MPETPKKLTAKDAQGRTVTITYTGADPTADEIEGAFKTKFGAGKTPAQASLSAIAPRPVANPFKATAQPATPPAQARVMPEHMQPGNGAFFNFAVGKNATQAEQDSQAAPDPYGADGSDLARTASLARVNSDIGIADRIVTNGNSLFPNVRIQHGSATPLNPDMPTYRDFRAGFGKALLATPTAAVAAATGGAGVLPSLLAATNTQLWQNIIAPTPELDEDFAKFHAKNPFAAELAVNAPMALMGNPFASSLKERAVGAAFGGALGGATGTLNRAQQGQATTLEDLGRDALTGFATGFASPVHTTDGEHIRQVRDGGPTLRDEGIRPAEFADPALRRLDENVPRAAASDASLPPYTPLPNGERRFLGRNEYGDARYLLGHDANGIPVTESRVGMLTVAGDKPVAKGETPVKPDGGVPLIRTGAETQQNPQSPAPGQEAMQKRAGEYRQTQDLSAIPRVALPPGENTTGIDWTKSYDKYPQAGKPDASEFSRLNIEDFNSLHDAIGATFPHLTREQARLSAILVESVARGSARQLGITTQEWYKHNLAGITRGGETLSQRYADTYNKPWIEKGLPEYADAQPSEYYGVSEWASKLSNESHWLKPLDVDDARQVLVSLMSHDASTVPHELAHIFQRQLKDADAEILDKWVGLKPGEQWKPEHDERFAPAYERWIQTGVAPHPSLKTVFSRFRAWLTHIYSTLRNHVPAEDLPPEIKDLLARYHADVSDLTGEGGKNNGGRNRPGGGTTGGGRGLRGGQREVIPSNSLPTSQGSGAAGGASGPEAKVGDVGSVGGGVEGGVGGTRPIGIGRPLPVDAGRENSTVSGRRGGMESPLVLPEERVALQFGGDAARGSAGRGTGRADNRSTGRETDRPDNRSAGGVEPANRYEIEPGGEAFQRRQHGLGVRMTSPKTKEENFLASSFEAVRAAQHDDDPNVVSWRRLGKADAIPYTDPETGKARLYYPDFLVTHADGTQTVEEIKPDSFIDHPTVQAKAAAAREAFGDRGIGYRFVSEPDLSNARIRAARTAIKSGSVQNEDGSAAFQRRRADGSTAPTMPPEQPKPTLADNMTTIYKAGLLSNPKTHIKNVLGNTAMQVGEEASRVPAALADIVRVGVARATGGDNTALGRVLGTDRTTGGGDIAAVAKASREGATRGISEAWEMVRTGKVANDRFAPPLDLQSDLGVKREFATKSPLLNAAVNTIFRGLSAQDRVFKTYAFRRAIEEQAGLMAQREATAAKDAGEPLTAEQVKARRVELSAEPNTTMVALAIEDAELTTFNNPNRLSTAYKAFRDKLADVDPKTRRAGNPFVQVSLDTMVGTFVGTPANVVNRTLEYTFGTLIAPAKAGARIHADLRAEAAGVAARAFTPEAKRDFAKTFGRGVTGASLIALGHALASSGQLTGYDADSTDRQKRVKAGEQAGSIRIGDTWYKIDSLSPVGSMLLTGATMREQGAKRPDMEGVINATGAAVAGATGNVPLTSGLPAYGDIQDGKASAVFGGQISSLIPAGIRGAAQVVDGGKARDTSKNLLAPVQGAIPYWRNQLPEKTVGGKPVPRTDPINPFNPFRAGASKPAVFKPRQKHRKNPF